MRFSIKKEGVDECEYISPVEFIPVLEETGLIIPAGRWILEQSAKQCSIWNEHVKGFRVNINVSYIQVMKSDVFSDIMSVIDKYSLHPSCIGIELKSKRMCHIYYICHKFIIIFIFKCL